MNSFSYREGDPEPEGVPAPTQARADYIKARVHGEDPAGVLPPHNIDVPYLGGTAEVGGVLSCTMGNWTGVPSAYQYLWQSSGAPIACDMPDYTVAASDAGTSIVCIVTATNAQGSTTAPASNAISIP